MVITSQDTLHTLKSQFKRFRSQSSLQVRIRSRFLRAKAEAAPQLIATRRHINVRKRLRERSEQQTHLLLA